MPYPKQSKSRKHRSKSSKKLFGYEKKVPNSSSQSFGVKKSFSTPKSALPTYKHRRDPKKQLSRGIKETSIEYTSSEYIYGRNAILEILKQDPNRIQKLFIAKDSIRDKDERMQMILRLSKDSLALVQKVPIQKLHQIIQDKVNSDTPSNLIHQGVVALITVQPLQSLSSWLESIKPSIEETSKGLVIALDEITDPHNIGAIIRVAETMGVLGVIFPKHGGGAISPVVSKVSSGADKYVPLIQVTNLNSALQVMKKQGFWILGSDCNPGTEPFYRYDMSSVPTVLVMGSEGKGLRPSVKEECDMLGYIPMKGKIQSLNVATATAIMAYEIVIQQGKEE